MLPACLHALPAAALLTRILRRELDVVAAQGAQEGDGIHHRLRDLVGAHAQLVLHVDLCAETRKQIRMS